MGKRGAPVKVRPPHLCNRADAAAIFGVGPGVLSNWVRQGCPRGEDGQYNTVDVFNWRILKERVKMDSSDALKNEKTLEEIEKLRLINAGLRDETIPREDHERILLSRASELPKYFDDCWLVNRTRWVKKSLVQLDKLAETFKNTFLRGYFQVKADIEAGHKVPVETTTPRGRPKK